MHPHILEISDFAAHLTVTTIWMSESNIRILDVALWNEAIDLLETNDPIFGAIESRFGRPPFFLRKQGYTSLIHIILEQQVSLQSAQKIFDRMQLVLGTVEPQSVAAAVSTQWKTIGVTRQKKAYIQGIACAVLEGDFDFDSLDQLPPKESYRKLVALKGIGPWTAAVYQIFCIGLSDVWPSGDLALKKALVENHLAPLSVDENEMERISQQWTPYRAIAARMLWHDYLSRRGKDVYPNVGS